MEKYLLDILRKSYRGSKSGRPDNNIHASDLESFCPRAYALCSKLGRPFHKEQYNPLGLSVTFDLGKVIQSMVTSRLLATGTLAGPWACECGHWEAFGIVPPQGHCSRRIRYSEAKVRHAIQIGKKTLDIEGNLDLIVTHTAASYFLAEAKSLDKDLFKALESPQLAHVRRVEIYLWLLKKDKSPYLKRISREAGVVLYISKGMNNMPLKAFKVPASPKTEALLESQIAEITSYLKRPSKLPRRICEFSSCLMARGCPVSKECFELKS